MIGRGNRDADQISGADENGIDNHDNYSDAQNGPQVTGSGQVIGEARGDGHVLSALRLIVAAVIIAGGVRRTPGGEGSFQHFSRSVCVMRVYVSSDWTVGSLYHCEVTVESLMMMN